MLFIRKPTEKTGVSDPGVSCQKPVDFTPEALVMKSCDLVQVWVDDSAVWM